MKSEQDFEYTAGGVMKYFKYSEDGTQNIPLSFKDPSGLAPEKEKGGGMFKVNNE